MRRNKIVLLGIFFIGTICLVSIYLPQNRRLFARWNLLLEGHVLCKLIDPSSIEAIPDHFPRGFTGTMLVYKGTEYIGYIDKFGYFNDVGSVEMDFSKAARNFAILYRIRVASMVVLLLWCGFGLVSIYLERRRSVPRIDASSSHSA